MHCKKWMLSVLAIVLLSCTSQVYRPTPGISVPTPLPTLDNIETIENQGVICFHEYDNSATVDGYFRPRGCFSSSCWQHSDPEDKWNVHICGIKPAVIHDILDMSGWIDRGNGLYVTPNSGSYAEVDDVFRTVTDEFRHGSIMNRNIFTTE